MTQAGWATKNEDMEAAFEILSLHSNEEGKPLVSAEKVGGGNTMQFTPSPWLGELTMNLVGRHGEERGMEVLRLVLRELGVFKKSNGQES